MHRPIAPSTASFTSSGGQVGQLEADTAVTSLPRVVSSGLVTFFKLLPSNIYCDLSTTQVFAELSLALYLSIGGARIGNACSESLFSEDLGLDLNCRRNIGHFTSNTIA